MCFVFLHKATLIAQHLPRIVMFNNGTSYAARATKGKTSISRNTKVIDTQTIQ